MHVPLSPEFLIDQTRFLPDLSYTFSQYLITCVLTWTNSLPVLRAHTFTCNWQQPFLNDSAEWRRMTLELFQYPRKYGKLAALERLENPHSLKMGEKLWPLLNGSFSFLQTRSTTIQAWMGLNFVNIPSPIMELVPLEHLKNWLLLGHWLDMVYLPPQGEFRRPYFS